LLLAEPPAQDVVEPAGVTRRVLAAVADEDPRRIASFAPAPDDANRPISGLHPTVDAVTLVGQVAVPQYGQREVGYLARPAQLGDHDAGELRSLAFSPDGKTIAAAALSAR